jgi:flavorubredoxin
MVTELKPGVYWVGAIDWGIKHFHGHELSTHRGTTYNAYLIVDEKVALVDTVWGPFADVLIGNIRRVIDPARIDYVVANHAEPDHAGALREVMRNAPHAEVVVSRRGLESIPGHFHEQWPLKEVGTGDTIQLGARALTFVEAAMLHWPDSMFTYVSPDAILLPNDAFGQHYATGLRFNDEVDQEALIQECLKYYANILTPYSALVTKKIDEVMSLNVPVDMIGPSHGVIWRSDPLQIVNLYKQWAAQIPLRKVAILYDTMWNATRRMAEAIAEGLAEREIPHALHNMAAADRNDVIADVFTSKAIVVGSPTLNNGLLPTITPILEDLRGLKFQNKVAAAFGSFGWSGEGVAEIEGRLKSAKIPIVVPGVRAKWQPDAEALDECRATGRAIADVVLERVAVK